jgi:hypothetical protein
MSRIDTGEFARLWLGGVNTGLQAHQQEQSLGLANRQLSMQGAENDRRHAMALQQQQENAQWRQMQQQGYQEDRQIRQMQLLEAKENAAMRLRQQESSNRLLQAMTVPPTRTQPGMMGPATPHPIDQIDPEDLRYADPGTIQRYGSWLQNRDATQRETETTHAELEGLRRLGGAPMVQAAMAAQKDFYQRMVRTGLIDQLNDDEIPVEMYESKTGQQEELKAAMIADMVIGIDQDGMPVADDEQAQHLSTLPGALVQAQYQQHMQRRAADAQHKQQERWEAERIEKRAQAAVAMAKKRGQKLTIDEARELAQWQAMGLTGGKPTPPARPTAGLQQRVRDARETYLRLNLNSDGKTKGLSPPTTEDYDAAEGKGWKWSKSREAARERIAAWEEYRAATKELNNLDGGEDGAGGEESGGQEADEIDRIIMEAMGGQQQRR